MRRSVAKEPMERIRRSPAAPQGAFGVADRSGEILADAAQKAAAQFEIVAKRRQEDWDKAKVNEAISRYLKWDQETRFDPQKGLMFTTGANAKGLFERSLDLYEKQAEALGGELENERQRTMFREAVIPHERAATFALSRQESTEVRKWNAEQAEERLKNEAVALAAGFDSPEAVDAAIASARQVNLTINGDQGIETNDKNETDVMRRLVAYGLDSLVKSDPLRAEAMLERFKSIYDGVSYEKLRDAVSKAALPVKAQDEAERLMSKYGIDGLSDALAEVRKTHEGKDEDVYRSYVSSLYSETKKAHLAELESAELEIQKVLYGGGSHNEVERLIASYGERFKGYGAQKEAWTLSLQVDNDRVHGTGVFAPKPGISLTRTPVTRAEAVRQLAYFNPEFTSLPQDEQERLVRERLGISEEQHDLYFAQFGEAKLRGLPDGELKKAVAMGYLSNDEANKIIEYSKNLSAGNKDYLKMKEKNIDFFLKSRGGSLFGGTQNPNRNTAVFYFREESRKVDPAAEDFQRQVDEAARRAMLRAIEDQHSAGVPLSKVYGIGTYDIAKFDTKLGTLKKAVDAIEFREVKRDLPPRPWQPQDTPAESGVTEEDMTETVEDILDDILELNSELE